MAKRYVSGNRSGALQSNHGETARNLLRERARGPEWFAENYSIIYELVPVPEASLKPQKRAAEAAEEENDADRLPKA